MVSLLHLLPGCACPSAPVGSSVMTDVAARSAPRCVRCALVAVVTSVPHAGQASISTRAPTPAWPAAQIVSSLIMVRHTHMHARTHDTHTHRDSHAHKQTNTQGCTLVVDWSVDYRRSNASLGVDGQVPHR